MKHLVGDAYSQGHVAHRARRFRRRMALPFVAAMLAVLASSTGIASLSAAARLTSAATRYELSPRADAAETTPYPIGTSDGAEPSGMAPPDAGALAGYKLTYVSNFSGPSPLAGWDIFHGVPGGDPGGLWATSHVVVSGGVLQLNAFQDPIYGNEWVTGGLCQCGVAKTYGAYFVRSRLTGAGPTSVELLWPSGPNWPPEIDFNETFGGDTATLATVHFTSENLQEHDSLNIDMTQWHTWGVVWTPTSITYTVDGQIWGEVTNASELPTQPMTLDIQQQAFCASDWACPTAPESVLVNWVAEYSPSNGGSTTPTTTTTTSTTTTTTEPASKTDTVTVGSFAPKSAALTPKLKREIATLAEKIKEDSYTRVKLLGYGDVGGEVSKRLATSRQRAIEVLHYLSGQLAALDVTGVAITVAEGRASVQSTANPLLRASYRKVVALIS